jgi:hypothetical protein
VSEGDVTVNSSTPTVADYNSSRLTAMLEFRDSRTNSLGRLYVPAPQKSIFLGDGETVDPSAITSLIAAAVGNLVAGSGNTVDQFTGGQLVRARTKPIETVLVTSFINPMTNTGDMIYSTDNVGDAGRLGIGSAGQFLQVSGGLPVWGAGPSTSLTTASAAASGNTTINATNTYFDGVTLSLTAGTWFIVGQITVDIASITDFWAKLWDGSTAYASGGGSTRAATSDNLTITLAAIVTLVGSATMRMAAAANNQPATILAALSTNGAGNNATSIRAIKVA